MFRYTDIYLWCELRETFTSSCSHLVDSLRYWLDGYVFYRNYAASHHNNLLTTMLAVRMHSKCRSNSIRVDRLHRSATSSHKCNTHRLDTISIRLHVLQLCAHNNAMHLLVIDDTINQDVIHPFWIAPCCSQLQFSLSLMSPWGRYTMSD